jgi:hypothetical protein
VAFPGLRHAFPGLGQSRRGTRLLISFRVIIFTLFSIKTVSLAA